MVGLAVEFAQLGAEVAADLGGDLLAAAQELVGERSTPVLGREDQMRVQVVDNRSTPTNNGIWFPPR